MKNLLKILSLGAIFMLFTSFSSASSNDCIERSVGNNSICVSIDKGNNDKYTVNSTIDCNGSNCAVACNILLPNNVLTPIGKCNGSFYYDSNSSEKVTLYITIGNDFERIDAYYNFRNGSRGNEINNNDDLSISTSDKSPSTNEYVDLKIDTDDDYNGKVYLTAEFRSTSNGSWREISNDSSTYFSSVSTSWKNGYVSVSNGYKKISNAFKFKKEGYYKITATDKYDETSYIIFNVGGSSSYNDEIELSTNDKNPSTNEYINLTIESDDDYNDKVYLTAEFKSTSNGSWREISNDSSTYFSSISTSWKNGYVTLSNGYKKISNAFKFKKEGYYKITATDKYDNTNSITFNVGGSSSYNDEIELSTSNKSPKVDSYVNLTINTDDDYEGKISFYKIQYRSGSYSSAITISRTNSTYFKSPSSIWKQGYYTMTYQDDGEKELTNVFKFAKKGHYRIYAKDEDNVSDYIDFNVGSSSNNGLRLEADDETPAAAESIKLTVYTDDDYEGKIRFSAEYKSTKNGEWKSVSRTDSDYFIERSDTWRKGYITMNEGDGKMTISKIFQFAQKGYYRITITDTDDKEDYIDFTVSNSADSPLDGFSAKEYETVVKIYNVRPTLISSLKNKYTKLKTHTTWKNKSDTLYNNMKDVKDKKSSREFKDYEDFESALTSWITYTQNLIN